MAKTVFRIDPFQIETAEEFRKALAGQGMGDLPVSSDLSLLGRAYAVNGRRFDNSTAIQPLEGLDAEPDGSPSRLTMARYESMARQGAGIFWLEAAAICREGRDNLHQLWIHRGNVDRFRELAELIDREAVRAGHRPPYKILQLTHSGRCSVDEEGRPHPMAAFASPYLDPAMGTPEIVTDAYIDQMKEDLAEAAALACEAGFEAIDLKLCHQYLMKEFLCAYTRPGKYGGCQENRFRFTLEAIDRIRRRVGTRIDITVRLNAYDAIPWPYGWGMKRPEGVAGAVKFTGSAGTADAAGAAGAVGPMAIDTTEVLALMRKLYRQGVRIFNLSTTSPRFAPVGDGYMDNFRQDAEVDPMQGVYHLLKTTGQIRQALPRDIVVVGTGFAWFGPFGAAVAAGCKEAGWIDVAGFGRNVLADKAFLSRLLTGGGASDGADDLATCIDRSKLCVGCDSCFKLFFAGLPTGCPVHREAYRELFRTLGSDGKGTVPIF